MRKIIFMGKTGAGKTTLTQRIKNKPICYHKTQYINYHDMVIDTPGEYIQNRELGAALALYAYEADVVGLLISATDQYSAFSPNITSLVNREVVGIVTHIDEPGANPERAEKWLKLTGCKKIFHISGTTGQGLSQLAEYLAEE